MTVPTLDAFPPDALEANRAGRLTDGQRRRLQGAARSGRSNELVGVAVFVILAAVLLTGQGPAVDATLRLALGAGAVAVAVVLLVRALTATDSLSRDIRDPHVERVEGAIERVSRTFDSGRGGTSTTHSLVVGGRSFPCSTAAYDAAPVAGWVAVYVLARSHRVVNLERLPDRALPAGVADHPMEALREIAPDLRSHDPAARAEALAELAALARSAEGRADAGVQHGLAAPTDGAQDGRPLAEAILGSWAGEGGSVEFLADGTATMTRLGRPIPVGWSVDAAGQLRVRLGSAQDDQALDAWVAGDELTIAQGGTGFTYRRVTA